ncbi:ImmA/IrrE family metallo-endopeptidase [Peptoniphilus catoniae]|uniref:ImmA/IrrE family metallo-endopeptidase n=1 Tax=Peptoniphilus catoniae TaxID=1660341 RepID=UPI0010FD774F|nr:ImmA/IrrE family metallo-endopeptidase [Peptoniphilus catoniae]
MEKEKIKKLAIKIYKKYGTTDPFIIARAKDYVVKKLDMPSRMKGYTFSLNRIKFIYINSNLTEQEQKITCLHELGHIFCKHDTNRIFTSLNTYFIANKLENEADLFMVAMLLNGLDKDCLKSFSIQQISNLLGVDKHKIELFF